MKKSIQKYVICQFDIYFYMKEYPLPVSDVVLFPERIKHIQERHPEVVKYIEMIPDILNHPDMILLETKRKDTIWVIKSLDHNIKLTVKLATDQSKKRKHSILQMQFMMAKEIRRNIKNKNVKNKNVKKIFDQDEKM